MKGKNKKCILCKKEFYEYPYQNGKKKFCSRLCSNKYNGKKLSNQRKGKNNPMYGKPAWNKGIPRTKKQKEHHSKIMKEYYKKNVNKIGFQENNITISQFKKGKEHPNYIDGRKYIDYPEEFNNKLKVSVFKRDNF